MLKKIRDWPHNFFSMIQESYSLTSPKTTIFLGLRGLFLMPNLDISMDLYNTLIVSCAYGLNKSRARSILRLNQKLRTLWRRKQDIETPKILYFSITLSWVISCEKRLDFIKTGMKYHIKVLLPRTN